MPKRKFDPVIRIWDTATGKETAIALPGHKDKVNDVKFSPNGKLLASGGTDGIRVWSMESGKEMHHWIEMVQTKSLAFSPGKENSWLPPTVTT